MSLISRAPRRKRLVAGCDEADTAPTRRAPDAARVPGARVRRSGDRQRSTSTDLTALKHVHVRDMMRVGMLSCDRDTPLRALAYEMAQRNADAVVVNGGARTWRIVSAIDIAAAAASGIEQTAGEAAATWVVTVSADSRLDRAAQLMAEHEISRVIVIDPASGEPIGTISALDVAAAYGA